MVLKEYVPEAPGSLPLLWHREPFEERSLKSLLLNPAPPEPVLTNVPGGPSSLPCLRTCHGASHTVASSSRVLSCREKRQGEKKG